MAYTQTSVPLENAIQSSCLQKCVPSGLIVAMSPKLVMRADMKMWGRETEGSNLARDVRGEIDDYERWGVWNLAYFLELFQHLLCHPSHTLSHLLLHLTRPQLLLHMATVLAWYPACTRDEATTVPKALANSIAHVLPVGSKVMRCTRGIQCEYVHLVNSNDLWAQNKKPVCRLALEAIVCRRAVYTS